jgi:hypothetical protein
MRYHKWLENMKSADTFLRPGGVAFYHKFSMRCRKQIRSVLFRVDRKGFNRFMGKLVHAARKKKKEKVFVKKNEAKKDVALVEQALTTVPEVSVLKFIPVDGLKNMAAMALAAGYRNEEVAAMCHMTVGQLNNLVRYEDIQKAKQDVPQAIIHAADRHVLRDLMTGEVDKDTEAADRIATRRYKLALDANKEKRETDRADVDALQKQREDHLKDRFGVDRKKGVVDVESKEEKA